MIYFKKFLSQVFNFTPNEGWTTALLVISSSGLNITFDQGGILTGTISDNCTVIAWDNGSSFKLFTDVSSGLWVGWYAGAPPLQETYLVTVNGSTITAMCLEAYGGSCGWTSGTGTITGSSVTLALDTTTLTGTISTNGTLIAWDNNSSWGKAGMQVLPTPIRTVHVVFMNHLDVGYNGIPLTGFINNILNIYFHQYFPRAIQIAEEMRALGGTDRFIYTTHPWYGRVSPSLSRSH